jgi:hypothetical protein
MLSALTTNWLDALDRMAGVFSNKRLESRVFTVVARLLHDGIFTVAAIENAIPALLLGSQCRSCEHFRFVVARVSCSRFVVR